MGPLSPIIGSLLEELTRGAKEERFSLQTHWPEIVGNTFSRHTQPRFNHGGTLCVWVDDSVLASELSQKYQGTILKRAGAFLGEGKIKKITFRVGGPR